jgi:uncharacterized protein YdcH (DUF465 family)
MIRTIRTDAFNPDFLQLNSQLDAELAIRDGKDHAFYAQYNTVDDRISSLEQKIDRLFDQIENILKATRIDKPSHQ